MHTPIVCFAHEEGILVPTVLLVEAQAALTKSITHVLERRGFRVLSASTCDAAKHSPKIVDCVVLGGKLPDGNAITLAGWLLAEGRAGCCVFFGDDMSVDTRLRASNLGTYVHRSEGIHRLVRSVADALADTAVLAVGAEDLRSGGRSSLGSGVRRR